MLEYDLAIDEYLHAIVRTRPWTISRETELLEALSDWLYAQSDLSVDLDAVTPAIMQRYTTETGLDESERAELDAVVARLKAWTETRGLRALRRAVEVAGQ